MATDKTKPPVQPQTTPGLGRDDGTTVTVAPGLTSVPNNPAFAPNQPPVYVARDRDLVLNNSGYNIRLVGTPEPDRSSSTPRNVTINGSVNRVANVDNGGWNPDANREASTVTIRGNYNEYLGANTDSYLDFKGVDNVTVHGEGNKVFTRGGQDTVDLTDAASTTVTTGSDGDTVIISAKGKHVMLVPGIPSSTRVDMGRDVADKDTDQVVVLNAGNDGTPLLADYSVSWNKEGTSFELRNGAGQSLGRFDNVTHLRFYQESTMEAADAQAKVEHRTRYAYDDQPSHDITLTPGQNVSFDFKDNQIIKR